MGAVSEVYEIELEAEIERLKATIDAHNEGIEQRLLDAKIEIERLRLKVQELTDERDIFARTLDKRDAEIERLVKSLADCRVTAELHRIKQQKEIERLERIIQHLRDYIEENVIK